MSFIEGFYSFGIELSDSDRAVYHSFRIKTARHPEESLEHLHARVLVLCHRFEENLRFSEGLFAPQQPTLWKHSVTEELKVWCDLATSSIEKLQRDLRRHPEAQFYIYFYNEAQIQRFAHQLRGSTTNWVSAVKFYQITPLSLLSQIPSSSSSRWSIIISDQTFFLNAQGQDLQGNFKEVDIWQAYQESLAPNPQA
jgi:uncharacterized protein YaeQ